MRKSDIALMLAKCYGYESYLEICTPISGRIRWLTSDNSQGGRD